MRPMISTKASFAITFALLMVSQPFRIATQAADEVITTPGDVASLRELERQVREVTRRSIPCVVAVETASTAQSPKHHEPFASGVIISADGLILSQYHVSHLLGTGDHQQSRKPGERIKVVLHDGSRVDAELLGADRTLDISLLRLVELGPYAFLPVDKSVSPKVGDWVLKLGHPMGFRNGRAPVVRLGRVLCDQDGTFFTDCSMTGGDSGGPFFNLEGHLVGIVRNSAGNDRLREVAQGRVAKRIDMLLSCTANSLIGPRLESMKLGEILEGDTNELLQMLERLPQLAKLDVGAWTQGTDVAIAYREVVEHARLSIVAIGSDSDVRITGTIVGADGWILTKASELPAEPMCRLPDGRVLPAQVSGVDPAFDIALLKIEASGLHAVEWSDNPDLVAGTLVAAPGTSELPLAVGIVSVASSRSFAAVPNQDDFDTASASRTYRDYRQRRAGARVLGRVCGRKGSSCRHQTRRCYFDCWRYDDTQPPGPCDLCCSLLGWRTSSGASTASWHKRRDQPSDASRRTVCGQSTQRRLSSRL